MRSLKTAVDRQGRDVSKTLRILACAIMLAAGASSTSAFAMNAGAARGLGTQAVTDQPNSDVIEVRAGQGRRWCRTQWSRCRWTAWPSSCAPHDRGTAGRRRRRDPRGLPTFAQSFFVRDTPAAACAGRGPAGTTGREAARSRPVRRSASSPLPPPQPGPAHRRRPALLVLHRSDPRRRASGTFAPRPRTS